MLVFSSTKQNVKILNRDLQKAGLKSKAIHSDLEQEEREEVLRGFKSKRTQLLIATDILSRGIDIDDIELVINYDIPGDAEDYIHRIGRTARASTKGEAITFINELEQYKFKKIEELMEQEVPKLPLPTHLGEGPIYDPKSKPKSKGNFKRKFKPKKK